MSTVGALLRRALEGRGGEHILTVDPVFSGLPDTAHGGSVLAVFDALAGRCGTRRVSGVYRRRVPLGVPLRLTLAEAGDAVECRLAETNDAVLVEGRAGLACSANRAGGSASGARARAGLADPGSAHRLPVSTTCFACGVDNPIGLHLQLSFDDGAVAGCWRPRESFRAEDGSLAPVALTTMLDEAAFWLGALASGESGMTTELAVTLYGAVPFGVPLTVAGRRDTVRPLADDPRYWTTEVAVWDDVGGLVAEARIVFVAVRGAARRLAGWLIRANPPDLVRRVFPSYT